MARSLFPPEALAVTLNTLGEVLSLDKAIEYSPPPPVFSSVNELRAELFAPLMSAVEFHWIVWRHNGRLLGVYSADGFAAGNDSSSRGGSYDVEFKAVAGWDTPPSVAVMISDGATETASGTYVLHVTPIPVIQAYPGSLNFVYVPVGSAKDLPLTVKNAGGGTLTGNVTASAPFSIVSGGSYSLGSGQTQAVKVRYQPTTPGPHIGTVVFTGGNGVTVPVTGKTENPPGLHWMMLLLLES